MREKPAFSLRGGAMLLLLIVAIAGTCFVLVSSFQMQSLGAILVAAFALLVEIICLSGLLVVNPNEGQVLQLFGTYVGTLREQGFRWVNPSPPSERFRCACGISRLTN
jgi:regulator of protease activity HflC (stomatin/prohibitin superfamily)